MIRTTLFAMLVALAGTGAALGQDAGFCPRCGSEMKCQEMCEYKIKKVLRYKVESTECPAPCTCCCDDRWILGCCKPIRRIKLKCFEEDREIPVRKYTTTICPHCDADLCKEPAEETKKKEEAKKK